MDSKLFLALLLAYSSHLASTHIVTSAHLERSFLACINSLTNMVQGTLCRNMKGQMDLSMERMLNPAFDREMEGAWQFRNNIKTCCLRPCTFSELIAIC